MEIDDDHGGVLLQRKNLISRQDIFNIQTQMGLKSTAQQNSSNDDVEIEFDAETEFATETVVNTTLPFLSDEANASVLKPSSTVELEVKSLMKGLLKKRIYDDGLANEVLKKMQEIQHLYQLDEEHFYSTAQPPPSMSVTSIVCVAAKKVVFLI